MIYEKHETLLKIENVSLELGKDSNKKLILKDINLELKNIVRPNCIQGQVVGLLAPSGMGKSKLFELLSGVLKPTTGTIKIGYPLQDVVAGTVGVVQQTYPLFAHRTILSNMLIASTNVYASKSEQKDACMSKLEKLGMQEHIDKYPSQISGGQRQRVAIAQQMVRKNKIYLLDEPFSGLDINAIASVNDLIQQVTNEDEFNTIIITSHDITNSLAISDTILILGRDVDDNNQFIQGAKIKYEFDLAQMNLAWQPNITELKQFNDLRLHIRNIFPTL